MKAGLRARFFSPFRLWLSHPSMKEGLWLGKNVTLCLSSTPWLSLRFPFEQQSGHLPGDC